MLNVTGNFPYNLSNWETVAKDLLEIWKLNEKIFSYYSLSLGYVEQ